jgi:rSAM/selenodomain-associated transferase 1
MVKPVVILFAKAPRLGTVKKRLARDIGALPALKFYKNILAQTIRKLDRLRGCDLVLAVTPDHARMRHPPNWRVIGQGQGDLGARMYHAFKKFRHRRAVLVGADIPDLQAADIQTALRVLKHCDAVFGPAVDGGYYLVGMGARRPAKPFAAVRWSSPKALADTAKNFTGLRVRNIRTLHDVDAAADLRVISAKAGIFFGGAPRE